jgi:tetratricopeptide (TPR) repeat protein
MGWRSNRWPVYRPRPKVAKLSKSGGTSKAQELSGECMLRPANLSARSLITFVVIIAASCGRPVPQPRTSTASDRSGKLIRTGATAVHVQTARTSLVRECTAPTGRPATSGRRIEMQLDELLVEPLPFGPRIEEMPHQGSPRRLRSIAGALDERRELLTACYRWARYQNTGLAGDLSVRLDIDVWGTATEVVVTPQMADGERLAGCVQDSLRGLALTRAITPRRTRASLLVRFTPSGQQRPKKPPARPAAPTPQAITFNTCLARPTTVPIDVIEPKLPVTEITDFSEVQEREDEQQRYRDWLRGGRRGPRPTNSPRVTIGEADCPCAPIDRQMLQERMGFNLGALRKCFRAAREVNPALVGTVLFDLDVDAAGTVRETTRTGGSVEDPTLVSCLQVGLSEVWFEPLATESPTELHLHVPIVLRPGERSSSATPLPREASIPLVETWMESALAWGDGAGAMSLASALIEQAGEHPNQCQWHLALFKATVLRAPWLDDRAHAAGTALARCLEKAAWRRQGDAQRDEDWTLSGARQAKEIAVRLHRAGLRTANDGFLYSAMAWYRLALRLERRPAAARDLHYFQGELLYRLERYEEAAESYAAVGAASPGDRLAHDASEALVFALHEAERIALAEHGPGDLALGRLRVKLVVACDAFVKAHADDERAPSFSLQAARTTLELGKMQEARGRAEAVLRRWPDGEQAQSAKELIQQTTSSSR